MPKTTIGKRRLSGVIVGLLMMAVTTGLTPTAARAVLIEQDLVSGSGDGFLISDTVNNLEWLDVTQTVGISATAALANYASQGFSLATEAQIGQLFTAAGIPDWTPPSGGYGPTAANVPGVYLLLTLMNHTEAAFGSNVWVHGYYDDLGDPSTLRLARFTDQTVGAPDLNAAEAAANIDSNGLWSTTGTHRAIGSFLVRTTTEIPAPGTLVLFGFGLAGIGYIRRKRVV